ncbi:PrsW family intramembrane metalloprotease [Actinomyces sp. ZJ308]|uniref:PrsW family intramembrane metalloprotease n=1 Tax=Actinomyces sp. ZJ308 TaxID=2708342 RepID=UPI001AB04E40|nr:PrsW family intramembrane metalloprotease [Actinomyces sp. ZJ308]
MSTTPSPWAPRPGYQRSSALPQTSADPSPLPGTGRRYQVHRESAPFAPAGQPGQQAAPAWTRPGPHSARRTGELIARLVLASIGALLMIVVIWVASQSASDSSVLSAAILLALIPLGLVLVVVFWIDRWEPEPLPTLVVAFLWGAGVATAISMLVNTTVLYAAAESTLSLEGAFQISAVVSAPLIEETTKGLGVLIIFLIWRRTFNGAIDGIVYASVVAAGFAFAENIGYFINYWDSITTVFIVRGVFSPFAHVTFTACTGLAIGMSSRRRSPAAWVWMTPIGLVCAIILHAIWNGVISSAGSPLVMFFLVDLPVFIVCIGIVAWLRWAERMTMRNRLDDYARAGWFAPAEVQMLTTGGGRKAGKRWAATRGPQAVYAMNVFQKSAAELAQLRQQAVDGHAQVDFSTKETELLDRITSARRAFIGAA